jgi:hypothetical protein
VAYFVRLSECRFRATEHTGGAWKTDEQHIAPVLGLLAHLVEVDRDARRDDALVIARASYDILGVIPVGDIETSVAVVRAGRTIELVEAVLTCGGRPALRLRAWLMATADTLALAGSPLPAIPQRHEMQPWVPSSAWPGGFIASIECVRTLLGTGRAQYWARHTMPLLHDEPVSATARALGIVDIINGMSPRMDPRDVAFPNLDLTAHLFARPQPAEGGWLGFDTSVSFGEDGIGLSSSVLHDVTGPIGTIAQILTIRSAS